MAIRKLQGSVYSTETMKVLACLFEHQLEFEFIQVDIKAEEHQENPFVSVNSFGQILAYEDGDLKSFEPGSILRPMAYEYGKKGEKLVYWDAKKQAIVAAWIDVEAHHFDPPATKLISDLVFHPTINGINTNENVVAEAEAKLARVLDIYEARLTDFKYLASNKFTLADLAHLPNLHYLLRTPRKKLIEERPHVNSWCNNIMARPAWGKVIQMQRNVESVESEGGPYSESSFTSKLDQTVEPTRKVYGCLNSVGTMRVLASLYEHEVDFEFVSINMDLGEHENKSFLAISPFGEVPAFQDGEWTLFESRAIMRFIFHGYIKEGKEHIYREPKLQGITSTWVDIEDHYFDPPASKLIQELVYKPSQNGFNTIERSTVAEEEAKLAKVLDIYEDRLSQYNYLGGNKFTSADLTHLPNLYYLMDTPVKRLFESRPHVNDWCNKIMTRPSWNQVVSMLKKATP